MPADRREFDVALLGATGFTGGLIAAHLAGHAPAGTRMAVAGRDRAKLEAVLASTGLEAAAVEVDVTDSEAVRSLAGRTRVLATTVGPYVLHGETVVAACADAGTDYLDLTGEPEFVDRTWLRHHGRATETGARLVHACGFDSVPHDLGAQFTVEQLPEDVPLLVRGYVRMHGTFSGGTTASALEILGRYRAGQTVHGQRTAADPAPDGRRVQVKVGRVRRDPDVGAWVVPLPTIDPQIVEQSARLLPRYGPDFAYSHYLQAGGAVAAAGVVAGAGALFATAQLPPARRAITRWRPSGSGPSEAQRARAWFSVRFVGEGGGARVVTEVRGGDPGYTETAKMIGEAALSLAFDDLPATAGQVTTAAALGPALRSRLQAAGITFDVVG